MKKKIKNRIGGIALVGIAAFVGGAAGYFGMEALSKEGFYGAGMFAMLAALVVSLYLSMFIHVLIHEGGHMVMGLATGYGFLSYRAGSHIWVKKENKIVHGRFQMPGTGGQCLLSPPKNPTGRENPAFLYNLGGGLFNLIGAALAAAAAFCLDAGSPVLTAVKVFFICFVLVGVYLGLINLIPLKIGGVPNDGYNMRHLLSASDTNDVFNLALSMYEAQCRDVRLKDLPEEMFAAAGCAGAEDTAGICDRGNVLEIGFLQSLAEKRFDERRFDEVEKICRDMTKAAKVPEIYKTQAAMLLILICMAEGRPEDAESLLAKKTVKKTLSASSFMPNTACIEYGRALLISHDGKKVRRWKERFDKIGRTYPFKADYQCYAEIFDMITDAASADGKEAADE